MLDPQLLLPFFLAVVVVLFSPGPNLALLVSTGAFYGFVAASFTALGITTALFSSSLLGVLGLSTLTGQFPNVFVVVRILGGLYFLYQAVKLFTKPVHLREDTPGVRSQRNAFLQGFFVESINPYSILFTFSFLPQFVNPELGAVGTQLLLLALLYCACDLSFNVCVARFSSRFAWLLKTRTTGVQRYLFGGGYACVSVYLLVQDLS